MDLAFAGSVVAAAGAYVTFGTAFALVFLPLGAARVDSHLAGAPVVVRLLIAPGVVAFWPLMAWRWFTGAGAPEERNPHRDAARAARGRAAR